MNQWWIPVADLFMGHRGFLSMRQRRVRRPELSYQALENRVTPSHTGAVHHLAAALSLHHEVAHHPRVDHSSGSTSTTSTTSTPSRVTPRLPGGLLPGRTTPPITWPGPHGGQSSNSALQTALKNLNTEVQTIKSASGTTVGQLTTLRIAFQTLASDKLHPTSYSALQSFENSLVTINATTPGTLTGNTTLQSQFAALFTSSPTSQQTTDLNAAYNALAAAVTSANVTSADITAQNSTSTASYPYFTLVTGQQGLAGPLQPIVLW